MKFAAKGIIFKGDKVLLLKKSQSEDVSPGELDIPGGGIQFGELPEEALKREVKEETGLEIDVIKPSRKWTLKTDKIHLKGITFYCLHKHGEEQLSDEHDSFIWIHPKEVLSQELPDWLKKELDTAWRIHKGGTTNSGGRD